MVTQLAAVSHVLHRADFKIVTGGMQQCPTEGSEATMIQEQMEKLLLTLA